MPDDKDNIVKFKPRQSAEEAVDSKSAAKQEMMDRLAEGARRMRINIRNDHIAYYAVLFMAISFVFLILAIAK